MEIARCSIVEKWIPFHVLSNLPMVSVDDVLGNGINRSITSDSFLV